MKGLFITFEGGEGCGKSTQIGKLALKIQNAGRPVVVLREPGGTPLGEAIRNLIKFSPAGRNMSPETELLLFAASRAQLVREVIQPELIRGAVVLCDRFMDSTTVYQGIARAIPAEQVALLNRMAVGSCIPDLTPVLDLYPLTRLQPLRRRARPVNTPVRLEHQPEEFYRRVRQGYLDLARGNPGRIKIVDASSPPEEVEQAVWRLVQPFLKT